MKKQITGYVTALADVYGGTLNQPMIKCLNNLLEFIEDIPEGNEEISNDRIAENNLLRKRITELEENCENMNGVEKNLHKKICDLTKEVTLVKSASQVLKERNEELTKVNTISGQCQRLEEQFKSIFGNTPGGKRFVEILEEMGANE